MQPSVRPNVLQPLPRVAAVDPGATAEAGYLNEEATQELMSLVSKRKKLDLKSIAAKRPIVRPFMRRSFEEALVMSERLLVVRLQPMCRSCGQYIEEAHRTRGNAKVLVARREILK